MRKLNVRGLDQNRVDSIQQAVSPIPSLGSALYSCIVK